MPFVKQVCITLKYGMKISFQLYSGVDKMIDIVKQQMKLHG